jgi:hypothetical protein
MPANTTGTQANMAVQDRYIIRGGLAGRERLPVLATLPSDAAHRAELWLPRGACWAARRVSPRRNGSTTVRRRFGSARAR